MARPRLARHMLDHHREQAFTEHLGREWQGYEIGNGVSRGPEGWAGPYTHRVSGKETEEHGNGERAVALGQEGAQC